MKKVYLILTLTLLLAICIATVPALSFASKSVVYPEKTEYNSMKIIKGNVLYASNKDTLEIYENSYIIVENGLVKEVTKVLPSQYKKTKVNDYGNKLIIPAFVDLHLHAPQFIQRGLGMDMELINWLNTYTFPNEKKFEDTKFAQKIYSSFVNELAKQGTLNSVVFGTIHKNSTEKLAELYEKKNIGGYIGKVNMDRNSPDYLTENTQQSLKDTEDFIIKIKESKRVKPIITPRFAPTSSETLLKGLGDLAIKYSIPVQSHLDENRGEVRWVKDLFPNIPSYSQVYNTYNLFGQTPTLMAHCIYLSDEEIELMKTNNVYAVHCPDSNINLSSGIMPVKKYLDMGINVGLGSDIGAGHNISMRETIVKAIQMSKVLSITNPEYRPLTLEEGFYLGTKAGGKFFGNVGSIEKGYSFDALVIDDESLGFRDISLKDRLQRFLYTGDDRNIVDRYFAGEKVN